MFKMALGAFVAAIAMFVTGFLFYATPLHNLAFQSLDDGKAAAVQGALVDNLAATGTGTYTIPNPSTSAGGVGYISGPVATIHFNTSGFPIPGADMSVLAWGFFHEFIICFLLGWALMGIDRRIPDYVSRSKTVIMFALAASAFIHLGNPIWYHHDWTYAIYRFFADAIMLTVAGMILARWFLPVAAEMPEVVKV
jgi:hypothetical protein